MRKEEVQNQSYEELIQLQQNGDITWVEFIEAQPTLAEEWKEWIDTRPVNEESAKAFLSWYDDYVIDNQTSAIY